MGAKDPVRWTAEDWRRFGQHAAIEAIEAVMNDLGARVVAAEKAIERLADLRAKRRRQIATGEWPPQPKGNVLSVRFTEAEAEALQRYANQRSWSVSEALRHIIRKSIGAGSTPDTGSTDGQ